MDFRIHSTMVILSIHKHIKFPRGFPVSQTIKLSPFLCLFKIQVSITQFPLQYFRWPSTVFRFISRVLRLSCSFLHFPGAKEINPWHFQLQFFIHCLEEWSVCMSMPYEGIHSRITRGMWDHTRSLLLVILFLYRLFSYYIRVGIALVLILFKVTRYPFSL